MTASTLADDIARLRGPILVLGASGFVGANLLRTLLLHRQDVFGTSSRASAWRLAGLPERHVLVGDLLAERGAAALVEAVRPQTVFNCLAYGAYAFETDTGLIYRTNVDLTARLVDLLGRAAVHRYVHAGSSSEYGDDAAGPGEDSALKPNSHYSVSKGAAAGLLHYAGTKLAFPCANLRLYAVYGPYEDASRLVPTALLRGLSGAHADYADPETSRDFVYVADVCEAFVRAAVHLAEARYGASFNVGSGVNTTLRAFAETVSAQFGLQGAPRFTYPNRHWDVPRWFADPRRAERDLGWTARTGLAEGLRATADWLASLDDVDRYRSASKRSAVGDVRGVSAVVACYKDAQAIPIMHRRLKAVFDRLGIPHEIIFVNDASPDDSEAVIRALSAVDPCVVGISHSRNFGSQSAFRSGMQVATREGCVLLDGDLQDPPELIEAFVGRWREGYDVVYGRRVKRDAPWHMGVAYKAFYRVFAKLSYVAVPRDAGDFALMDRRVVDALLSCPERDLFIRGLRAFVGFRQVGVDYVRPERMFGVSTNNLFRNIGWAKKGILSYSRVPLNALSVSAAALFALSVLLGIGYAVSRVAAPEAASHGSAGLALAVAFFGSLNLLAVGLIGEYAAKIFDEVKARPHFVRRAIIRGGEIRDAADASGAVR